jgi:hypothetical protein
VVVAHHKLPCQSALAQVGEFYLSGNVENDRRGQPLATAFVEMPCCTLAADKSAKAPAVAPAELSYRLSP